MRNVPKIRRERIKGWQISKDLRKMSQTIIANEEGNLPVYKKIHLGIENVCGHVT